MKTGKFHRIAVLLACAAVGGSLLPLAGCRDRVKSDAASVRLVAGKVEVVVSPTANAAVRFAADEMTNFLSRVLCAPVPISTACSAFRRNAPTGEERVSIILGTNAWSAAAGIDVANLKRDGFWIGAKDGAVFIAGRDDPAFKPLPAVTEYHMEIATLYGVYDFLEKFAGCRFYFPGELGEIVPRKACFDVPDGLVKNEPDWKVREISHQLGPWFEPSDSRMSFRNDRLFRYRVRHQTQKIPCCHGLEASNFSVRFGKEHPEYFRLKDGKRWNEWKDDTPQYYHSMLCYSSDVWEEAYRDAVSYFRGEGPEVRGRVHGTRRSRFRCFWGWNVSGLKYYDIMPQDGMGKCECPTCQAYYAKAKDPTCWADELIWEKTVKFANRLKADGFGDRFVTQMAYWPYNSVPDIDIPDNVLVMVCSNGSWVRPERLARDMARYRAWNRKRKGTIWAWNNTGKHSCSNLNIRDLPCVTPHAFGKYYKEMGPIVFGAYCDNSAEKFIYSALNYYVFCKIAWDNETDVDALLEEYYSLMFGKAAAPMRRVFELIEEKWMNEVLGNTVETSIGSVTVAPTVFESWTRIYTPSVVRKMAADFAAAASAVAPDTLEARRIAMMKREFLDPIVKHTEMYTPEAAAREEARRAGSTAVSLVKNYKPVSIRVTDFKHGVENRRVPVKFEPGKTYRVSYFLTCEDVRPYPVQVKEGSSARRYGGVQCVAQLVTGPKNADISDFGSIGGGVVGNFKRLLQEFTLTAPKTIPPGAFTRLTLRMYNRTGTATFEDLRVEEVAP